MLNASTKYSEARYLFTLTGLCILATFFSCSKKAEDISSISEAYGEYIQAHTAGAISKHSSISLRLSAQHHPEAQPGSEAPAGVFQFDPPLKGKTLWADEHTLEFQPDKPMRSGQKYTVRLSLNTFITVPRSLRLYTFSFQTMSQNFELATQAPSIPDPENPNSLVLQGYIITADRESAEDVEKMLKVQQSDGATSIHWQHDQINRRHNFEITGVQRRQNATSVVLEVDGKSINLDKKEKQEITIPAIGHFILTQAEVTQSPDQFLSLRFSDPLDERQNFEGLVQLGDVQDLRFQARSNELRIFLPTRQNGYLPLTIFEGVKNRQGHRFNTKYETQLLFEQVKPAIRFTGKGNILPSTDGMVLPFEAVNLHTVDVSIVKVYENTIPQFLQVNRLAGSRQMRRVAYPLVRKMISLKNQGVTDFGKWNRFTLDLNDIIQQETGALYQVELSFRQEFSTYICGGNTRESPIETIEFDQDWDGPGAYEYWEDDYYHAYDDRYRWEERDNPCHITYYLENGRNSQNTKNILASDLGLLTKKGQDGRILIIATDLKTARPLSGVNIEILDFQLQKMGEVISNRDGMAWFSSERSPFLIVGAHQQHKSYLRVDEASALSLSHFDIGGDEVQKGLKGFIYGERGVWRPGDSLHLSFMIQDKLKTIPPGHPIIFELINPRGKVEQKITRNLTESPIYSFITATSEDAITGNWMARVKIGGSTFEKGIKIESIKPNRLKIQLDFDAKTLKPGSQDAIAELKVSWLHGVPARSLRAVFDVVYSRAATVFSKYPGYTFEDPSREFYSEKKQIFDGRTDAEGRAGFKISLPSDLRPPGKLNAWFSGRVFEESGDFSVDRFNVPVSPYKSYTGIKLKNAAESFITAGEPAAVQVVVLDDDQRLIPRRGLKLEVYKLNWQWWWDRTRQNLSSYVGQSYLKPVFSKNFDAPNGSVEVSFNSELEWGRYYLKVTDPTSDHSSGLIFYMETHDYGRAAQSSFPEAATMLSLSSDKERYTSGEKVTLNIPGAQAGRALVSIENGSGILSTWWIDTQAGITPFSFTCTDEMSPNIYVHVHLLQAHSQTVNDLPIRLYGVLQLQMESPGSRLTPRLQTPESFTPGQKSVIKVSEKNGKPMSYTLAIVDEGLLDITRFKTPNPHDYFYAREALGVRTWDLYDDVIGAFGGKLEKLLAIGGDGEGVDPGSLKSSRFTPVVTFLGPFYLAKGKTASHEITMPQYIGSVRTMLVAADENAYGHAEASTAVKQDVMVLGTLPRVLGPGESLSLPVNIFAMNQRLGKVKVTLKTSDLLKNPGDKEKYIEFETEGEKMIWFDLLVANQTGFAYAELEVVAGTTKSTHRIDIEVRNPNPFISDAYEAIIEPGKRWEQEIKALGASGTNQAMLEVSTIPPVNLARRLSYLIEYPHGCLEQTVSAAFPQLYLNEFVDLTEERKALIEQHIRRVIERLARFQHNSGAFSMWPGTADINDWATSYTGHFLLEARRKGYTVSDQMLKAWGQFQEKTASDWSRNAGSNRADLLQSYRLYTLALAGTPARAAMNRLRENGKLSQPAKWRLAAAFVLTGQPEAGKALIQSVPDLVPEYQDTDITFGSALRDEAMILETMVLLGDKGRAFELLKKISSALNNPTYWMSTQTTAYALLAVSKFAGMEDRREGMKGEIKTGNLASLSIESQLPLVSHEFIPEEKPSMVQFTNTGKSMVFVRLLNRGKPSGVPDISESSNGIQMQILYKNMQDEVIQPVRLEQGTDFVAEVTLYNSGEQGAISDLVLQQVFPSGWEIHNSRMDQAFSQDNASSMTYQDIRDDRVYTYFDLNAGQRKTFRVYLNAAYTGTFYMPVQSCEAMYDGGIYSRKPGMQVQVVKP
jgi:alpha-2-macroglobulin